MVEFVGRSAMHLDLPFHPLREDLVHIRFRMNLSLSNPNRYDL